MLKISLTVETMVANWQELAEKCPELCALFAGAQGGTRPVPFAIEGRNPAFDAAMPNQLPGETVVTAKIIFNKPFQIGQGAVELFEDNQNERLLEIQAQDIEVLDERSIRLTATLADIRDAITANPALSGNPYRRYHWKFPAGLFLSESGETVEDQTGLWAFEIYDVAGPETMAAPSVSGITPSEAQVDWLAAQDESGISGYEYRIDGGAALSVGNVLSTGLTGLAPETEYFIQLRALDTEGNEGAWSPASFFTTEALPVDTEAPARPQNVRLSSIGQSSALAEWEASTDNVAIAYYEVRVDLAAGGTLFSRAMPDAGLLYLIPVGDLSPGTDYTLRVRAVDTSGNLSSWSQPAVPFTTQANTGGPVLGPSANWSAIASGLSVAFTNQSQTGAEAISSWEWDFGDGNNSTESNPEHTYGASGTYTVQLTLTDLNGLQSQYIDTLTL